MTARVYTVHVGRVCRGVHNTLAAAYEQAGALGIGTVVTEHPGGVRVEIAPACAHVGVVPCPEPALRGRGLCRHHDAWARWCRTHGTTREHGPVEPLASAVAQAERVLAEEGGR